MKHVSTLKKEIKEGLCKDPHYEINELLEFGPSNTEAIKLKAFLYHYEGRFQEEASAWSRILDIDSTDEDALYYLKTMRKEDIEYLYFTQETSEGRKFHLFPKKLVKASIIGLLGCLVFLYISSLLEKMGVLTDRLSLEIFFFTVVGPWMYIIYTFFTGIKLIDLNKNGMGFVTRLKKNFINWNDIQEIKCVHDWDYDNPSFKMIITTKLDSKPYVINLGEKSPVRAKTYFIRELNFYYQDLVFCSEEKEFRPSDVALSVQ